MDQRRAEDLVAHPSESLNVELKRWLDPSRPEHKAKVVRALMALRNRNGGYLVVGFDDVTHQPAPDPPDDPEAVFHTDIVQGLVT